MIVSIFCILLGGLQAHVLISEAEITTECESYDSANDFDRDINDLDDDQNSPTSNIQQCERNPVTYCYALWANDSNGISVRKKGCFSEGEKCVGRKRCVATEATGKLFYCCCEGDRCNRDFYFEPAPISAMTNYDDDSLSNHDIPTYAWLTFIGIFIGISAWLGYFLLRRRPPNICPAKAQTLQPSQDHSSPSSPVPLAERLLPVVFLEKKAEGTFGTVWKAKLCNKIVAVKIIRAEYRDLWETEQKIFQLPHMKHDNILQFEAAEQSNEGTKIEYRLITAYHELGSLHDYLKINTVTWDQLCRISFTMTRGLARLHEEILPDKTNDYKPAIAHRDFKSANVLLKSDMSACIADFGFALTFHCHLREDAQKQVGTRRYMAPETLQGTIGFTNHAFECMDMYACGLVLWELLSRCSLAEISVGSYRLPYANELGERPSIEDLKQFVVYGKGRPHLQEVWKKHKLLSNVCEIIEECWDADADARLSAACVTDRFSWHLGLKSETRLLYNVE